MWILGHSFIFWAQRRAAERIYTENLDLDPNLFSIYWHGKRGMVWGELLTELGTMAYGHPHPDIIIIHLGGNDIGKQKTLNLIFQIKHYIRTIKALYPGAVIVFSEIIPRLKWLNSGVFLPFEKIRKRINRVVEKFMAVGFGFSFRHSELEGGIPGLYRPDEIHLSNIGLDILNCNLQACIEKAAVWG